MEITVNKTEKIVADVSDKDLLHALRSRFLPKLKDERYLFKDGALHVLDRVLYDDYDYVYRRQATERELVVDKLLKDLQEALESSIRTPI